MPCTPCAGWLEHRLRVSSRSWFVRGPRAQCGPQERTGKTCLQVPIRLPFGAVEHKIVFGISGSGFTEFFPALRRARASRENVPTSALANGTRRRSSALAAQVRSPIGAMGLLLQPGGRLVRRT
jgi:hypothetical protein